MIALASGPYAAQVNPLGGGLAGLSYEGVDLIRPQADAGGPPEFRGAVLAPWPNRIGGGTYHFGGADHHLPITEPERRNALHGLVLDDVWRVRDSDSHRVELTLDLGPVDGYPFRLALGLIYELDEHGLTVTLEATNAGERPAPYGCGFHPYVLVGAAGLDEAVLAFEATRRLRTDPERLLPIDQVDVVGTMYDFSADERIGTRELDDAFTGIAADETGLHRLTVGDVGVWWDSTLPWVQVYTPPDRGALAVEPCTSPPDAFRTGNDLVVLAPAASHRVTWGIGQAR